MKSLNIFLPVLLSDKFSTIGINFVCSPLRGSFIVAVNEHNIAEMHNKFKADVSMEEEGLKSNIIPGEVERSLVIIRGINCQWMKDFEEGK